MGGGFSSGHRWGILGGHRGYNIIVVGGGPAGLTAAMMAAKEGFSVLLVDTKKNISRQTRPCCSMWLLEPGFHNEGWTFDEEKIYFHRNDFCIPYTGEVIDLYRSVRITAEGHSMVMGKRLTPLGKVINKQQLLQDLLGVVEKVGVEVRPETTCLGIEESEDGVKALLRHRESQEWVTADYLFAADGVDSRVAASLGLNDSRKLIMRTPLLEHYYADVKTPYPDAWVQFVGDGFNGVSGYMLHKPDFGGYHNVYEICALIPKGSNLSCHGAMQCLLEHPTVKELLSGARLIKKMGCKWSIWSPIKSPARNRVILLGDAASFQEAENQGAIMCGYRAAKAVAAAESGDDGFAHYNRFWKESFEFNDPQILQDTWKGFIFGYLGQENLNYVISLADGLFLDGYINHFKFGNTILEFIHSQMPRIRKERPDLAEKIIDFEKFKVEENIIGEV